MAAIAEPSGLLDLWADWSDAPAAPAEQPAALQTGAVPLEHKTLQVIVCLSKQPCRPMTHKRSTAAQAAA